MPADSMAGDEDNGDSRNIDTETVNEQHKMTDTLGTTGPG